MSKMFLKVWKYCKLSKVFKEKGFQKYFSFSHWKIDITFMLWSVLSLHLGTQKWLKADCGVLIWRWEGRRWNNMIFVEILTVNVTTLYSQLEGRNNQLNVLSPWPASVSTVQGQGMQCRLACIHRTGPVLPGEWPGPNASKYTWAHKVCLDGPIGVLTSRLWGISQQGSIKKKKKLTIKSLLHMHLSQFPESGVNFWNILRKSEI